MTFHLTYGRVAIDMSAYYAHVLLFDLLQYYHRIVSDTCYWNRALISIFGMPYRHRYFSAIIAFMHNRPASTIYILLCTASSTLPESMSCSRLYIYIFTPFSSNKQYNMLGLFRAEYRSIFDFSLNLFSNGFIWCRWIRVDCCVRLFIILVITISFRWLIVRNY